MPEINLSPYTAEYDALLRRRQMADALMQQGQKEIPVNQMAGGYVVPVSKYAGIASMLKSFTGGYEARKADQEMKDLAAKRQEGINSDQNALVEALRVAQTGKPEIPMPADELGGGPGRAAQAPTGRIDPAILQNMRSPEGRSQTLQLLVQQLAPKGVHTLNEGASLVRDDGTILVQGRPKQEFGTTPHYEMVDGVPHAVVYDKQGNRKVIGPASVQNQFNTPSVDSTQRLSMDMFRHLNMSEQQKQQLAVAIQNANAATANATNRGVQTQFETGGGVMPQGVAPGPAPGSVAPSIAPQQGRTGTTLDLNNPGGLRPVGASTGFQQFKSPEEGIQGVTNNLKAYGDKGINTIEKIVSTWAPSNENDTKAYISHVSRMLGVPANQPLDMKNPYVLHGLTTAIMTKEQGPRLFAAAGGGQPALTGKSQQAVAVNAANQRTEMEQKREFNMSGISDTISEAERILSSGKPTASGVGTVVDYAASIVGGAPKGAAEADQLRAIGGKLVAQMPRMEGPQSDKDVVLYREMAGRVGDSTLPIARRQAALSEIRKLWAKYDKSAAPQAQSRGASGSWGDGWSIKPLP